LRLERKAIAPRVLVDLKRIKELKTIKSAPTGLRIGALAAMNDIASSSPVQKRYGLLAKGASVVGSIQTRNRATLGGNLCNASPAADTATPLIALSARAVIAGGPRQREVLLEDFFLGPGKTCLQPSELLKEIFIPSPAVHSGGSFQRCTRTAMDIAVVNCAVFLLLTPNGESVKDVRIALGAVGPTPIRAKRAEDFLRGKKPDESTIEETADHAAADASPIDDVRSTASYRQEMVRVLTRRGITEALKQARGEL
jgi:carbon-monoxide dehydrogenase medium subunit